MPCRRLSGCVEVIEVDVGRSQKYTEAVELAALDLERDSVECILDGDVRTQVPD